MQQVYLMVHIVVHLKQHFKNLCPPKNICTEALGTSETRILVMSPDGLRVRIQVHLGRGVGANASKLFPGAWDVRSIAPHVRLASEEKVYKDAAKDNVAKQVPPSTSRGRVTFVKGSNPGLRAPSPSLDAPRCRTLGRW